MESVQENPLVSTVKSTSGLQVVLHPLVLLTVSDYITRHTMRGMEGPIVCGLLGQTHGREITIEHAFDCHLQINDEGEHILHEEWFTSRVEQMRLVHTDRGLDLVGWSTILPQSGPQPAILALHNQILSNFNESSVLLGFHPELIASRSGGGKLPLTIYESRYEVEGTAATQDDGEDQTMKDSGDATAPSGTVKLKFSELPYSVEMGEAEVISMDTVARTATAASAVADKPVATAAAETSKPSGSGAMAVAVDGKGKKRIVPASSSMEGSSSSNNQQSTPEVVVLSRDEDEMMASLTTKANAVKMLHSRIKVLLAYLEQLPPEFVTGAKAGIITDEMTKAGASGNDTTIPDYTILRSIQALVNRLPLVVPSDEESFNQEVQSETNDVKLIGLLREVVNQTGLAKNVGRKAYLVDSSKGKSRGGMEFATTGPMGGGGFSTHLAGDLMGL